MTNEFPRLNFEQLSPRLRALLQSKVARLGYLGEFFQCTAVQPDILEAFLEMTDALKDALPDRLTELAALTIATLMGNAYERHQHERLSKKLGFGEDWVAAVEAVAPDTAPHLSETERAVQRLVVALVERRGKGVVSELDAVFDAIGPEQTIAIMFLAGRYMTHALIVNALSLAPPVPSIFEKSAS